jgi:hypothetical protein
VWRANTSEERLLGVSLTGIMDNTLMSGQQGMEPLNDTLQQLKAHAVQVGSGLCTKVLSQILARKPGRQQSMGLLNDTLKADAVQVGSKVDKHRACTLHLSCYARVDHS